MKQRRWMAILVMLAGCADKAAPVDTPAPAAVKPSEPQGNRLSAPIWKNYLFGERQIELPGEPKTQHFHDVVGKWKDFILPCSVVRFIDSDLVLITFVLPLPDETRPPEQFYSEFQPVFPTWDFDLAQAAEVVKEEKVVVDGKVGCELTLQRHPGIPGRNPGKIIYRMFLMEKKVYILMASSKRLEESEAVVQRFFGSLKIEGKQPLAAPDGGKPKKIPRL